MKAYIFPGQGSQFAGMGKDLYEKHPLAKELFEKACDILGFDILDIMFNGTAEDLKQTRVTQPSIFLHSVISAKIKEDSFQPNMVAGHSLGEFSALTAVGVLSFEDGLKLVYQRAQAMQEACEYKSSTMAAVIGLDNETVERICSEMTEGIVVPANYNYDGQLVISGDSNTVEKTCEILKKNGAKKAVILAVGGAFHSPIMEPAKEKLSIAISNTEFKDSICPIYQNITAKGMRDKEDIKRNLIAQLTAPVMWSQSVKQMMVDGATEFIEVGPGKVLQTIVKKINPNMQVSSIM
ncbi:ACP S-malonyltransferase [Ichthyobacterium seriolicida]|uniref:Malonyl CoA-acyl carrier protein transacylase n=1 Tax=Ichthyobacterium seriolicida TaxID=242600 RepID=A0A1J1DZM9_9FLAO|nr:ACP S-malonyltransferase [Ichthyobacterium seriolicida]BAV95378.1 malonyl CoA-acyl carrier protein transacylase [Ichthyobacterium seriolicida]